MTTAKVRTNNPRLSCPHCGSFARIRNSGQLTELYREATIECQNEHCGWRGKIGIEVVYTVTPSQRPKPGIRLPLAPHLKCEDMLAQLSLPTS